MSSLPAGPFAPALRQAQDWLDHLRSALGAESDEEACRALRATLQVLRDSLTVQEVGALSSQLPLLIRGLFLEGWDPDRSGRLLRPQPEFLQAVLERSGAEPIDTLRIVAAVFDLLGRQLPPEGVEEVKWALPLPLRALWPERGGRRALVLGRGSQREGVLSRRVGQSMTREVLAVSASAPLQTALEAMTRAEVRHMVVLSPARARRRPIVARALAGILSRRDAVENARLEWLLVRDVMTHGPLATVAPEADLAEACALLHQARVCALPVLAGGELVGLLSSDDLCYEAARGRARVLSEPLSSAAES